MSIFKDPLTERQRQALDEYETGKSTPQIAIIMGISISRVVNLIKSALRRLEARKNRIDKLADIAESIDWDIK